MAVVVLVVIVALFVAAVLVGSSGETGSAAEEDENSVVDRLADVAGDPAAVPLEDVTAGCASDGDPTLLVFGGGCTIVVRSDDELRVLRLQTDSPIEVVAPAPDGDVEVEAEIDPGKEAVVAVGEGVTEVELSCRAGLGDDCRVRMVVS